MRHHFTLRLFAVLLILAAAAHWADGPDALCSTDTDCAELCPADDAECDGGPEQ